MFLYNLSFYLSYLLLILDASCVCVSCLCVFSEALGHENPMFLGGSPQVKTHTVSQIMTRQSSESGRHLLSEPGTPLSPPPHGDVFFPVQGKTHTVYKLARAHTLFLSMTLLL